MGFCSCQSTFALVRPPGHHASFEQACGFCLFNNVAICAKHAVGNYGLERVLIVDWDVHAAQGTQYAITDDPRIRLLSLHRFENGLFWPNLPESLVDCKNCQFWLMTLCWLKFKNGTGVLIFSSQYMGYFNVSAPKK